MVAQYISTRPIMDLCERYIRRTEDWVSRIWRDQEAIDIEGGKERAVAESEVEEEKYGEGSAQEEIPGQN